MTAKINSHKKRDRDLGAKVIAYFVLSFVVVITLYPVIWMLLGSLKSPTDFYSNIWGLPLKPVWQNYVDAWVSADLGEKFLNSTIVTLGTLALVLPIASLAAYTFAKMRFVGKNFLFYFFFVSIMIPRGVTAIPTFSVVIDMGLLNTRLSLILVLAALNLGFSIFIMRAFFLTLPKSIEEAALVDGCSPMSAFFRVVLPISKPAYATIIIFTGLNTWNEYFMSSILIRSEKLQTLPISLVTFIGQYNTNFPQLFAALSIITLPVVIIYILGQKQFIEGLTEGAVKG